MKKEGQKLSPLCETTIVHKEEVERIKCALEPDPIIAKSADLFKIFGDMTRLKILCALLKGQLCVCDIAALLGISQSGVSHQLRILKQANLVSFRRAGKTVYYSPADDHIRTIINQGMAHIME